MEDFHVPEHVLDALLCVASDYMTKEDFHKLLDTDWTKKETAEPAWKAILECLQNIASSPFPGPKETTEIVQLVLAKYHLRFDGRDIVKLDNQGSQARAR